MPLSPPPRPQQPAGSQVLPIRPRQEIPQIDRVSPVTATAKAARDAEVVSEAVLLRNRRLKLGAGATIIVVIAASLFGAQLKEVAQTWRRRREIQAAADRQVLDGQIIKEAEEPAVPVAESRVAAAPTVPSPELAKNTVQADREILRQIALLEDRRAMLNRQKGQIQAKIEHVEARQVRNAEMEARQAGPGINR